MGFHPVLNFVNIPTSALTLETENYVSYFVYFSDLIAIYSYFITIILITMNNQHFYKHFKWFEVIATIWEI